MEQKEFLNHLKYDIIPFWMRLKDDQHGGFYGFVSADDIIDETSDKGIILNDRILWFYSSCYLLLKDEALLSYADHAYEFLMKCGMDKENGGVYWSLDHEGNPKDTTKHTYNQAFAVYALSSYYEASGNRNALKTAMEISHVIETRMRDEDGYLEAFTKNFIPSNNKKLSENGVEAKRTMNTALHILEAYTELYRVSKNMDVRKKLMEVLFIFKNKIYNPERKITEVFFDSSYHTLIDLESYGHEIEASWLLRRALDILKDDKMTMEFKDMIQNLAESVYSRGMDENHASIFYESECGIRLNKRAWWVMAEGVTGFYDAYVHSGNEKYLNASSSMWDFIKKNMITEYGEWKENFWDTPHPLDPLVHPWKCPYHNGRMCMEMMKRLK